ncbi:HsdM family class I SAM-dependent methyltransferase [Halobacillus sp. K22]|uniref:HsdM family class I SAM-dependent methyltransferase n=1 Tax=Halobacillus sp. K22 TaxID=3457431 RepID=UPI003FCD6BF0
MLSPKRTMGQYSTPEETVTYMTKNLLKYLPSSVQEPSILDPCTGDGIFIKSLLQSGFSADSLYAFDIDPRTPPPDEQIHFIQTDFLKESNEEKFDAIIGNPPYKSKRQSSYLLENKKYLSKEFQEIGVHNLYTLFIYKGIQKLKDGGILTMIVQDSFLSNVYYKNFRRYILAHTEIKEIILAPRRLFHKGKADVRTCILTLKKGPPDLIDKNQTMKLIDRLIEQEYTHPPEENIQYLEQFFYENNPNYNFSINVPTEILSLFHNPYVPLGDVVKIVTGISTGNDKYFLRKPSELTNHLDWLPFYKNGGSKDAWYYEPKYYIHKDWPQYKNVHSKFMVRNPSYYYREGITCSSMGVEFSAAYLPQGSLFGVNANLFPENHKDLLYFLGLLNSQLVKYLLRKFLNRTNMITAGYLKKLPYVEPSGALKEVVVESTASLIDGKKKDPSFNTQKLQREVDQAIFDTYGIPITTQTHVMRFCKDLLENI